MTTCWANAATEAEAAESAQLAKTLGTVKQKGTAEQAAAFSVAEEKWKAYRDAQCEADAGSFAGGSAQPMASAMCRTRLATDRAGTLARTYRDWATR